MDQDRRERAERWASILAMVAGVGLVILAMGRLGVLWAVAVAAAFIAGVIAQRV